MTVRIEFTTGPLAGRRFDVPPDASDRIVIGRDPDRCQVLLPADMASVGREHVALRRHLGRYRLELNGSNAVWVDGEPALNDQEIPAEAELQLGRDGPRLRVEAQARTHLVTTKPSRERPSDAPRLAVQASAAVRRHRRLLAALSLVLVAAVVLAAQLFRTTGRRIDEVALASEAQIRELRDSARRASAELEERVVKAGVPMLDLAHVSAQMAKAKEQAPDAAAPRGPRFEKTLANAERSVCLVLMRDVEGSVDTVATAWVAGEDVLVTNAHVAQNHAAAGKQMVVRTPGEAPEDFVVTSVEVHPGYAEFTLLLQTRQPSRIGTGGLTQPLQFAPACDVALLRVDVPRGRKLPPALPLAPREALEALAPGQVVGAVGFPMEAMVAGGVNPDAPQPLAFVGHITALTDFLLGAAPAPDRQLVQHTGSPKGGSSGSPIVDDQGRVVAVLSASGHYEAMHPQGRAIRISMADAGIAQRADLADELLSGRAASAQKARKARWSRQLDAYVDLEKAGDALVARYVTPLLQRLAEQSGSRLTVVHDGHYQFARTEDGIDRNIVVPCTLRGKHVFVAWTTTAEDVDLLITKEGRGRDLPQDANPRPLGDGVLARDVLPDAFPVLVMNLEADADVVLHLAGEPRSGRVHLRVLRLEAQEPAARR